MPSSTSRKLGGFKQKQKQRKKKQTNKQNNKKQNKTKQNKTKKTQKTNKTKGSFQNYMQLQWHKWPNLGVKMDKNFYKNKAPPFERWHILTGLNNIFQWDGHPVFWGYESLGGNFHYDLINPNKKKGAGVLCRSLATQGSVVTSVTQVGFHQASTFQMRQNFTFSDHLKI